VTTAIDWENWGVTEARDSEFITEKSHPFYDAAWYAEWQAYKNSIQTTAYSIINLHDLELNDLQTTQASYQDPRNQMATSFDNLFVQTTSDSLQFGPTAQSSTSLLGWLGPAWTTASTGLHGLATTEKNSEQNTDEVTTDFPLLFFTTNTENDIFETTNNQSTTNQSDLNILKKDDIQITEDVHTTAATLISDQEGEEEKTEEDSRKMKARLHPESVLTRDDEAETNGNEIEGTNGLSGNEESEDQTVDTDQPNHNLTESTSGSSDKVSVTLNLEVTTISPNETLSHDETTDVNIDVNPKILTPQGSSSFILEISFPLLILTVLMR